MTETNWSPKDRNAPRDTWNYETCVEAIRDWWETTGRSPRQHEWRSAHAGARASALQQLWMREYPRWPSVATVVKHCGSWTGALEAAGVPARHKQTRDELTDRVEAAKRLSEGGFGPLRIAGILHVTESTVQRYLKAQLCSCGNGYVLNSEHGVCFRCAPQRVPHWTRDQLLARYNEWTAETGAAPTWVDWQPLRTRGRKWFDEYPRWPSAGEATAVFGDWLKLQVAAGRQPRRFHGRWTPASALAALASLARELGRPPTSRDLAGRLDVPSAATLVKFFGSVRNGVFEATGVIGNRPRTWEPAAILPALAALHDELGRLPQMRDLIGRPDVPGGTTLQHHFGSFSLAIRALVEYLERRDDQLAA